MKRMTAEKVAAQFEAMGASAGGAWNHAAQIVRENLVPQWQDEPDEDTHARCPWWWCEDLGKDSPPQLLRCYRPLKATLLGDLTVDMQAPKEWTRWTVSGWVPLVGRVCPIGERPK